MANEHTDFNTKGKGDGKPHADYIAGLGKYKGRVDVVFYEDKNLPIWAESGDVFWTAVDKNERGNGRAYTELEWSIPRECSDPKKWAQEAAQDILGSDFVYRLAVHNKMAADGLPNPHFHLMFSERKFDGIRRETPEHFFKKADSKKPERGGNAKDRTWNKKEMPDIMRLKYREHVRRIIPDFDFSESKFPEEKIGPAVPKAGKRYAEKRAKRQAKVDELRQAKAENLLLEFAIQIQQKGVKNMKVEFTNDERKLAVQVADVIRKRFADKKSGIDQDFWSITAPKNLPDPAPDERQESFNYQISGYSKRMDNGDVLYTKLEKGENADPDFLDFRNGKQINVFSGDDSTILEALKLAQEKWGGFSVSENDECKKLCARLAAENGLNLQNDELQIALPEKPKIEAVLKDGETQAAAELAAVKKKEKEADEVARWRAEEQKRARERALRDGNVPPAQMTDSELQEALEMAKMKLKSSKSGSWWAAEAAAAAEKELLEWERGSPRKKAEEAKVMVKNYREGADLNGILSDVKRAARRQNVRAYDAGNHGFPELAALETAAREALEKLQEWENNPKTALLRRTAAAYQEKFRIAQEEKQEQEYGPPKKMREALEAEQEKRAGKAVDNDSGTTRRLVPKPLNDDNDEMTMG
jgi:hypothetical protein